MSCDYGELMCLREAQQVERGVNMIGRRENKHGKRCLGDDAQLRAKVGRWRR